MSTSTEDTGSGPVDGEEIRMEIVPHHQKHPHKQGNSLVKFLFTGAAGAAVVSGIVGLYLLYKHFFGKKKEEQNNQGSAKLRKRSGKFKVSDVEDEMKAVYNFALEDEEFLEFLEQIQASGLSVDV